MNKKNFELPLSPNYVHNWGIREAIREILQNAIDADKMGYEKEISFSNETLYITSKGTSLPVKSLILGCTTKDENEDAIGQFGEGYKLALLVLLRKGYKARIINQNEIWTATFKESQTFQTQLLNIEVKPNDEESNDLTFEIYGFSQTQYDELVSYFPCITNDYGAEEDIVESENGYILLDKRFKGKMFVEGLYIQSDNNFEYGYNFSCHVVKLDRDRKAINYYELRKLTASSFITVEKSNPRIFKAIGDSIVDTRDIKEVLDEASDHFLEEYRDMVYIEKKLEENTLIATEGTMRQLEQMGVDVPVVRGSEIESYLIAKANDKLDLIYEAEEYIQSRSDIEEAFDSLKNSSYRKMMIWFLKHKKYLTKTAQKEFIETVQCLKTSGCYKVEKYIPDDFDFSIEAINELEKNFEE